MADIDSELRQKIDEINLKYMHNTGWNGRIEAEVYQAAMSEVMELVKQSQLELLSRIKEEVVGGREQRQRVVCTCQKDKLTSHRVTIEPSVARNNLRAEQRAAIDNIAKEIRGNQS